MGRSSTNLPALLPTLIGREEAIDYVRALLLDHERGVLTLTGTGGSGKTRLALAVATDLWDSVLFPDGVWLVELAPISDPLLIPSAVAASVGIKEQPGRSIRDTLLEQLRKRSQLLVLDNCEHVVEACAALSDDMLRNCPSLHIMTTSREPLRIPGERVWRVPPLPTPDMGVVVDVDELAHNPAVRLFVERAQAVQSTLTLTAENAPAIAAICARLDGLPLAIELAAARARVLTPDQIRGRLDDVFRLLVGGSRTAPTRQQTLRATLDWSYRLLTAPETRYFEQLAVFAGGFDLDGVDAVWSAGGPGADDALDMLTQLVDRSLVVTLPQVDGMRYRLLEPVREYAYERLRERDGWDAAWRHHAEYFLRLTDQAEEALKGPAAREWQVRLQSEHDNVRAAMRRCLDAGEPEPVLRIGSALRNFWQQFGYRNEGRRWLEEALSVGATVPPVVLGNGLQSAATIAFHVGDYRAARTLFERAVQHWRNLDNRAGLASTLVYYGRVIAATAETSAEYHHGKALMQEGIALNREAGTQWWVANGLMFLGRIEWEHAELDLALASSQKAEQIFTQLDDGHSLSHLHCTLGGVLRDQGDLPRGQSLIEQSLAEARAIKCVQGCGDALYVLAGLKRRGGELDLATQQAAESVVLQYQIGETALLLNCVELLAGLMGDQGQAEPAATLLAACAALRQNMGLPMPPISRSTCERDLATARAALGRERYAAARAAGWGMTLDRLVDFARRTYAAASQPQVVPRDPLSQRERQVLALLARGYTNRQIAQELVISGRTADGHVAHILTKLGLSTRAQAAVWAVEHPLASAGIASQH